MNRSAGRELTAIEVKRIDVNHAYLQIDIRLQKLSDRIRRHVMTACESNVRMP